MHIRQIVLDTETTGIGADFGHRIIEIGGVELIDRKLSGKHFHSYLNPLRQIDDGAFKVHGISAEFLADKPFFADVVNEFLQFIDGAELIIHNAPFDVAFLNSELKRINWHKPLYDYCSVFDTLAYARQKHPAQRNGLDALCKRYDIDNSNRQLHGALLDAQILALVYLAMTGGQGALLLDDEAITVRDKPVDLTEAHVSLPKSSIVYSANAHELQLHAEFIEYITKKSGINHWV